MGREEDRKRFERNRMHQSIDRGMHSTGHTTPPMDRFGVRLKLGDLVLYTPTYPTLFQVSEIVPVLDPNAPPGTVQLVLSGVMPLVLDPNKPCISVVHVETPEGAEAAIKRHHAGRAVSGGNGEGPVEVVDAPPGDTRGVRATRQIIDPGVGGSDGPTANAEGGGSIEGAGDREGDGPGPGSALASTDPLNHPSEADRRDGSAFHHADLADRLRDQGQGASEPVPAPAPEPQSGPQSGVGSAASGAGSSEVDKRLVKE